jgi:hypothetical protein
MLSSGTGPTAATWAVRCVECSCGNEPHLNGFHTVHRIGDGRWVVADPAGGPRGGPMQCVGCGAVYSESYEFVEVAAIAPRD